MEIVNHTTLVLLGVLVAATLVMSTLAVASSAFASDSSKTITKQKNKQKQKISGDGSEGIQDADNCIAVLNGANACRTQGQQVTPPGPPPTPPPEVGCPEGTLYNVKLSEDLNDGTTIPEGTILCLPKKLGDQTATVSTQTPVDSITSFEVVVANPNISPCPESPTPGFSLANVDSGNPGRPIGTDGTVCIKKQ
jgi:hypothetical protein